MPDDLRPTHEAIVARHLEAENAHRLEETVATLHPECLFEDLALDQTYRGREGAADYYRLWWSAFDLRVKGGKRYWLDDMLIAETNYVGSHVGSFLGLEASGRPLALRLAVFIGFRDGLMAGERFYYDSRGLLAQLGAERFPAL